MYFPLCVSQYMESREDKSLSPNHVFTFIFQILRLLYFINNLMIFQQSEARGTLRRYLGEPSRADLALVAILFVRFWGSRNSFRQDFWLQSPGGTLGGHRWYRPLAYCIRTLLGKPS